MTQLATGLDVTWRGCFASMNGRLYFTNDRDRVKRVAQADQAAVNAGIAAPQSGGTFHTMGAPTLAGSGGSMTAGAHLFRYRYYDSKTLYLSDPSDPVSATAAASDVATFSVGPASDILRSSDPKVDTIVIEMTTAGGAEYFWAKTIANSGVSSVDIDLSDAALVQKQSSAYWGNFGHELPPVAMFLAELRQRMVAFGHRRWAFAGCTVNGTSITAAGSDTFSEEWIGRRVQVEGVDGTFAITARPSSTVLTVEDTGVSTSTLDVTILHPQEDALYWSRTGLPESWKPFENSRRVFHQSPDTPAGLHTFQGDLYLFGSRTIMRFRFNSDPSVGTLVRVPGVFGLWNQQAAVEAEGTLYGWSEAGFWAMRGSVPQLLIDTAVASGFDSAQADDVFAVFDPVNRDVLWFYPQSGDTYASRALCYSLITGQFTTRTYLQELTCGLTVPPVTLVLGDANSSAWAGEASNDGAADGSTLTVDSGATTTSIPVDETLVASEWVGRYARIAGEDRLVTVNTTGALTLGSALSSAPAAGAAVRMGPVDVTYQTGWVVLERQRSKFRPARFCLSMIPGEAAQKIRVYVYTNYSATPAPLSTVAPGDNYNHIAPSGDGTHYVVDGDADFVSIPMPGDWVRAVQVKLVFSEPQATAKILDAFFDAPQAGRAERG